MLTDERLDEIGTCLERANSVYPISAFAAYCEARNALTEHAAEYLEDLYDEVCRLRKCAAQLVEANEELHNLISIYRNDNPTA